MASQKLRDNTTESKSSSESKKKPNNVKSGAQSHERLKSKVGLKKVKKISKSIKRIESEMSRIQTQLGRIGKDLTAVLELIQTKK